MKRIMKRLMASALIAVAAAGCSDAGKFRDRSQLLTSEGPSFERDHANDYLQSLNVMRALINHSQADTASSISVLEESQREQALAYASLADHHARDGDFDRSASGLPVVAGSLAHFECSAYAQHPAGDHTMLLGEVTGLSALPSEGSQALSFYKGVFSSAPKA